MNEKRMNQRVGDAVEEFTTKEKSKADRTDDLKRERKVMTVRKTRTMTTMTMVR